MRTNFKLGAAIAIGLGSSLCGSAAYADGWPINIQGSWSVTANQNAPGIISITQNTSTLNCQPISGTIAAQTSWAASTIKGFYCPTSGRINFVRIYNGTTVQSFQGNLSAAAGSNVLYMGGTFSILDTQGGSLGEYNFSAVK
jgi:hypothetical protein